MTIEYSLEDGIAVLRADNPPVNALGTVVRQGLSEGVTRAINDEAVAILIYGAGRTWFAGADIREFGKPLQPPILPDLCNQIEACPVPVVAALHGTVLGGGLEVALSCHYRLAVPGTRLGLPEVTLGVLPGAGGTQRLPRLAGYEAAVTMITGGRPVTAEEALQLGIVDELSEGDPRSLGIDYVRRLIAEGAGPRRVGLMDPPAYSDFDAVRATVAAKARGQLSPVYAFDAVRASSDLPFAEGLAEERRLFHELMQTDQRKGLIHAFFAERQVSKLPELDGLEPRPTNRTGIVGGGTMGAGIATAALLSGVSVVLVEQTPDAVNAARGRIEKNLSGALRRGKISEEKFNRMTEQALTLSTDYMAFSEADLIIEAAFEDFDVKRTIFRRLDSVAKKGAVLASNTSYLNLNEIAATTSRPADVVGLHFFSPAHVMRLLEVVVGDKTASDVVKTAFAFAKKLNKVAVRSGVCDGFIGNRILQSYRTAADHMVLEGASPWQIDRVMEAFGFAMGPFAVADLAGLDIGWANRKRLAPFRDPRERVSVYCDRLCEQGCFGQKTGRGYYIYDGGMRKENPQVAELIEAERAEKGIRPAVFSDEEILRRYMAAMVNESAKVVGEGIARRPLDVDITLLMGYGFPRYHGGPMKWADMHGLDNILSDIRLMSQQDAYFWQEAPLLADLVNNGRTFEDLNAQAG